MDVFKLLITPKRPRSYVSLFICFSKNDHLVDLFAWFTTLIIKWVYFQFTPLPYYLSKELYRIFFLYVPASLPSFHGLSMTFLICIVNITELSFEKIVFFSLCFEPGYLHLLSTLLALSFSVYFQLIG